MALPSKPMPIELKTKAIKESAKETNSGIPAISTPLVKPNTEKVQISITLVEKDKKPDDKSAL